MDAEFDDQPEKKIRQSSEDDPRFTRVIEALRELQCLQETCRTEVLDENNACDLTAEALHRLDKVWGLLRTLITGKDRVAIDNPGFPQCRVLHLAWQYGFGCAPPQNRNKVAHLDVQQLRQTHDTVSKQFVNGPHKGELVEELVEKFSRRDVSAEAITPLVVVRLAGKL